MALQNEEINLVRLWIQFAIVMAVWCGIYVFCHFFVWNPIKVKEVSDLQVYTSGDIYVDQRARSTKYQASYNFSWMRLSVNGQKYQCDCTTHHCRVTDYLKDKLQLDGVSFFIINKRYCFVTETIKNDNPKKNKIGYSYYLDSRAITREQLAIWRPKVLRSDYHEKVYRDYYKTSFVFFNFLFTLQHWSLFVFYVFLMVLLFISTL